MELEEAKKILKLMKMDKNNLNKIGYVYGTEAIKTVLEALENSIPKEEIKDKIEELNEEFNNYEVDVNCSQDSYYELSDRYAFIEEKMKELLEDK